jgi:hypothetical protein
MDDSNLTIFFNDVVKTFNKFDWEICENRIFCYVTPSIPIFICFEIMPDWHVLRIQYRILLLYSIDIKRTIGSQKEVFKSLYSWLSSMKTTFNNVVD